MWCRASFFLVYLLAICIFLMSYIFLVVYSLVSFELCFCDTADFCFKTRSHCVDQADFELAYTLGWPTASAFKVLLQTCATILDDILDLILLWGWGVCLQTCACGSGVYATEVFPCPLDWILKKEKFLYVAQ